MRGGIDQPAAPGVIDEPVAGPQITVEARGRIAVVEAVYQELIDDLVAPIALLTFGRLPVAVDGRSVGATDDPERADER